jgi:hypothetical protein
MIIKLKDGTEIHETPEKAEKIKQAIEAGAVGIELGDKWFRADWVATIMPGGTPKIESDKLLPKPDYRGQESPAKEKLRMEWGK